VKARHDLIRAFYSALKPPPPITVSEWAASNRIIPPHKSAEPGRWRNERTPYLVKIMDSFNDPRAERIIFCSATQVGKTQAILNMLGYLIDCDPDTAMIVYPTEDTGRDVFRDFIDPMINACPALAEKKPSSMNDYTLSRIAMKGGATIFLAWANSPASLASKPVRYLFLDEVDKYPVTLGREANPIELAKERTSTFWNRKIVIVSTPTIEGGPIWQEMKYADKKFEYLVPCPHCMHRQKLIFEQIKWSNESGLFVEAERTAYYECEKCKKAIYDHHKPWMLENGGWVANNRAKRYKSVAFHLPGLYSPWRTFGQFVRTFLETKKRPEKLQNFVNSWLAEPWRDDSSRIDQDEAINSLISNVDGRRGLVNEQAVTLTAGVDVQEDCLYYVVRGWAPDLSSWLVLKGVVTDWEMLERVLFDVEYEDENGRLMKIELAAIDSGYRTDEVYRFVAAHYPFAIAIKGASTDLGGKPFSLPSSDSRKQLGVAAPYIINTRYFKDFIYMRRRLPAGEPGAWHIYAGVTEDYLKQITAEVRTVKKGKPTWQKRSEHAQNHYWDAEVYAAAAAEILGVSRRTKAKTQNQISAQRLRTPSRQKTSWLGNMRGWL